MAKEVLLRLLCKRHIHCVKQKAQIYTKNCLALSIHKEHCTCNVLYVY